MSSPASVCFILSSFLQENWDLESLQADSIDWLTNRDSIAQWAGGKTINSVLVGCFELGGSSTRTSATSVVTDEPVEVKVQVKGQANLAANQALRITVFNAVKAILTGSLNGLINGNLKVAGLRYSGGFDTAQCSSRDVIVTLEYPEGS